MALEPLSYSYFFIYLLAEIVQGRPSDGSLVLLEEGNKLSIVASIDIKVDKYTNDLRHDSGTI